MVALRMSWLAASWGKRTVAKLLIDEHATWERLCRHPHALEGRWSPTGPHGHVSFPRLEHAVQALRELGLEPLTHSPRRIT